MRGTNLAGLGLAAMAAIMTAAPGVRAAAAAAAADCTDNSRACLAAAAQSYYDAIVSHSGATARFADQIRYTLQARGPRSTAEARAQLDREPAMQPYRDLRFWADEKEHTVFVLTLLPVEKSRSDDAKPATVHAAGRFRVENGRVTEYEGLFRTEEGVIDGTSGWEADSLKLPLVGPRHTEPGDPKQASGKPPAKPGCTDASRACLIRAANSYYDALTRHDGSAALLASNLRHTVQYRAARPDKPNGESGPNNEARVREILDGEDPAHAPPRDRRVWVDEQQQTVFMMVLLPIPEGGRGGRPSTTHVAARFKIAKGLVSEYEALFFTEIDTDQGKSNWEGIATAAGTQQP